MMTLSWVLLLWGVKLVTAIGLNMFDSYRNTVLARCHADGDRKELPKYHGFHRNQIIIHINRDPILINLWISEQYFIYLVFEMRINLSADYEAEISKTVLFFSIYFWNICFSVCVLAKFSICTIFYTTAW